MSSSARQNETISRPIASRRAASGLVYHTCSKELNTQNDSRLGSTRIPSDNNTPQDHNPTDNADNADNAINANLGTSGVGGHPSGIERTHRKLKCSKPLAHMLETLRNKNFGSSTNRNSSIDAVHSASVLRVATRRSGIDTQVHEETIGEDRSSDAHLIERKRDKALRFAMLVVGLSNLGIQLAQLI